MWINCPFKNQDVKVAQNVTTKTITTTTETVGGYKPRNKTYFRQEVKEEVPTQEQKSYSRKRFGQNENNLEQKPKNRTYVRTEVTNNDGSGRTGYYKRKMRFTTSTSEN